MTFTLPRLTGFLLCLAPIIAALSPRALAFYPTLIGLIAYGGLCWQTKRLTALHIPSAIIGIIIAALALASPLWGYDSTAITTERGAKLAPILLGATLLISAARPMAKDIMPIITKILPLACLIGGAIAVVNLYGDSLIYRALDPEKILRDGNFAHLNRGLVVITFISVISGVLLYLQRRQTQAPLSSYGVLGALALAIGAIALQTESQSMHITIFLFAVFYALPLASIKATQYFIMAALGLAVLTTPFLAQWLFTHIAEGATQYDWLRHSYAANRMEIWDFVSRRALESPWLGHGIEATRSIRDFDIAYLYHKEVSVLHPHNFAVQIWLEFGALGAVCAAAFLAYITRCIYQMPATARRIALAAFLTAIPLCAVSYGLWQSWWVGFWSYMIALCAITASADKSA